METISNDFKKVFLLTLTKELIKHSEGRDIKKLQRIIELEESKIKEKIPSAFVVKEIPLPKKIIKQSTQTKQFSQVKNSFKQIKRRQPLFVPEPKLPAHLEYLKPIPAGNAGIDLFKINPLISDPAVRIIEGNPDENAIVTGAMGTKPTSIFLNKEDVDRIINKFSEVSKIPVNEGIYRVVIGNLIISAVISNVIGSRFIIKKMIAPREPSSPRR
jgi:hypothetical protein